MKFLVPSLCLWFFASGMYSLVLKEDPMGWWYVGIAALVMLGHALIPEEKSQKKHGL